jgi:hypothetical protein
MVYVRRLIWDSWNVAHIGRHEVTPEEVEEACHGDALVQQTYAGPLLLIGPTLAGRMLAVVLAPESRGVYYPVTARPASRKERTLYKRAKGGDAT